MIKKFKRSIWIYAIHSAFKVFKDTIIHKTFEKKLWFLCEIAHYGKSLIYLFQLVRQPVYTSLFLLIIIRFTCGKRKICSNIKKSQNIINMIVCKILFFSLCHYWQLFNCWKQSYLIGIYIIFLKKRPRPNLKSFQYQIWSSVKRSRK